MTHEKLVDHHKGWTGNRGPVVQRVYRDGGATVRVRVAADSFSDQSYAVAEVLNAHREWTELVVNDPQNWLNTGPVRPTEEELVAVADELFARARRVLGA